MRETPLDIELSLLDQMLAREYIRLVYCFPARMGRDEGFDVVQIQADYERTVIARFTDALHGVMRKWPALAYNVATRPQYGSLPAGMLELVGATNPNFFRDTVDLKGRLSVKHLRDWKTEDETEIPSWAVLEAATMAPSSLPTAAFCPLPDAPEFHKEEGSPVLHVALNFIEEGLVVAIYASHSVVDIQGLAIIIEELAKYIRGEGEKLPRALRKSQPHIVPEPTRSLPSLTSRQPMLPERTSRQLPTSSTGPDVAHGAPPTSCLVAPSLLVPSFASQTLPETPSATSSPSATPRLAGSYAPSVRASTGTSMRS